MRMDMAHDQVKREKGMGIRTCLQDKTEMRRSPAAYYSKELTL